MFRTLRIKLMIIQSSFIFVIHIFYCSLLQRRPDDNRNSLAVWRGGEQQGQGMADSGAQSVPLLQLSGPRSFIQVRSSCRCEGSKLAKPAAHCCGKQRCAMRRVHDSMAFQHKCHRQVNGFAKYERLESTFAKFAAKRLYVFAILRSWLKHF